MTITAASTKQMQESFVTGHDFSRAENAKQNDRALATAKLQ
jgi:hypothetical protein